MQVKAQGPATQLVVTSSSGTTQTAGIPFTITVTAEDGSGNTVLTYSGSATISSTDSKAVLSPTDITITDGVGTCSVTLNTVGSGTQTIYATDDLKELTTGSLTVTVDPGALSTFVFSTISTPQTAGTAISGVTITAEDAEGNTVTSYASSTTLTETGGGAGGTVTQSPVTFTSGVWTGSLTVTKSGTAVTITATGSGQSGVSTSFTVNPSALSTFVFSSISTPQTAGTAISGVTITAEDAEGNTVTSYASSTTLTETGGGAGGTVTQSPVTFTSGVWTGSLTVTKSGTAVTITATGSGQSGVSTSFTVNPSALSTFVFSSISTPQTAGTAISGVTITAEDAEGNTVTSYASSTTLTETGGGAGGTVTQSPVTFTSGVWTGSLTVTKSGTAVTITATGSGQLGVSTSFTVNPSALSTFVFSSISTPQTAGTAISGVTITAEDAEGNTVTSYASSTTLTETGGGAGGTVTQSPVTFTSGVWTGSLTVTKSGTAVTITATGSGQSGVSTSFTVNPAGASIFVVSGFPSPTIAGVAHSIMVTAKDTYGNLATGYAGTVKITSSDSKAVLPPSDNLTDGVGSFTVTLNTAGTQTIMATDTLHSLINGSQTGITVNVASGIYFVVSGFPSTTVAGVAHSVTVIAYDAYGNLATGYAGTVKITSSDSKAVLPPSDNLTDGVGSFTVTLNTAGTQTIMATDTVNSSINGLQNGITVNAGGLDHFAFSFVGPQTAGAPFSVTITAKDSSNNTVTSYSGTPTLSCSAGSITPSSATGGFESGIWIGSVTVTIAGSGVTITTTDGSYSGASNSFTVNPGVLDHFVFNTVATQTVGFAFSITVTAKDAYGNTVTSYTGTPSLTCSAGSISPNTMDAFVSGVGSTSVTVTTAGSGVTITTTTDGTHTGTSNSFVVNPSITATPTPTPIATPTLTPSPSPTPTSTPTPNPTTTPTSTPIPTPSSSTPTPSATSSPISPLGLVLIIVTTAAEIIVILTVIAIIRLRRKPSTAARRKKSAIQENLY